MSLARFVLLLGLMINALRTNLKRMVAVAALLFSITVIAQPNLAPYQPTSPPAWSDKIVISTIPGTSTNSTSYSPSDTLYLDWAVVNLGNTSAGTFITSLYVDGVLQSSWTNASLSANTYITLLDHSFGPLTAGNHTIQIKADSGGTIQESNEGDNSYSKVINVAVPNRPNLTPVQPAGWSDKIVVSKVTGTTTDAGVITTVDPIYVDWAVINNGPVGAGPFSTSLFVDNVLKKSWPAASLVSGASTQAVDYAVGSLSAGSHTIKVTTDSFATVTEGNETDNTYTRTISVAVAPVAAPTLIAPANGATGIATTPAFTWSAIAGATSYRIMVASSAGDLPTDTAASTGGASLVVNATSTTTNYTPTIPINPGTTYYWQVHGLTTGGIDNGAWSSVRTFTTVASPSGLTIVPIFDSSITSDPQSATIQATINAAIAVYASKFSSPTIVSINFQKSGSGLGSSSTYYAPFSYSSYRAALVSHATSTDDTTALAHLPASGSNPVNGNVNVNLTLPLARTLGFDVIPPAGEPDGTVFLNISEMNVSAAQNDTNKYALFSVVSHEIDEVLGFGSALNGLANGDPTPTGAVSPHDLFRYNQNGARTLSTSASAQAYFSLDGTTHLARFSQAQGGDFQDWYSPGSQTPQVQDAVGTPGSAPVLGVELRVLDVIGYTPAAAQVTITASAGSGGSISPSGSFNKNPGDSQLFTATANSGYFVNQWLVDGGAVQTGGNTYTLSNIQANHSVQVTFTSMTNQTISFGSLADKVYGDAPFGVSATASSGLPVSFSIFSGPATVAGNTVTITGAGTVVVRASQGGSATYNAAPDVDQSFTVTKANQTITFNPLPNKALGEPAFAVSATTTSGLTATFSIFSGPASIVGSTITVTNVGTVVVRAAQAGNGNYNAAANVDRSFEVYAAPTLSMSQSGANIILSWPTNVAGFALVSATNLMPVVDWTAVVPAPVVIGNQYVVTNSVLNNAKFYRLKK